MEYLDAYLCVAVIKRSHILLGFGSLFHILDASDATISYPPNFIDLFVTLQRADVQYLCVSAHFLKRRTSRRSKGGTILISGEFSERRETI